MTQLEERLKAETALRSSLQASYEEKSKANLALSERVEELNTALAAEVEKKLAAENERKVCMYVCIYDCNHGD